VPPRGYVVLGIDLARTNDYTVLYGARMRDRRNCYFDRIQAVSWPEQKRRIRRAVSELRKAGAESVMLVIDSTGVGDPIAEDLEADGYDVVGLNFTTYKNNMVRLLAKDLEEARAFILEDGQITEFENYTMKITPAGKMTYAAPEGEHDDVVSAKMLQHWGIVNEGVGEVSILRADENDNNVSSNPRTPEDELDMDLALEDEEFSDLIDEDEEMSEADVMDAIGLGVPSRPLTPQELLLRQDVWN
jgi:phage FluMu gp28-like protein